MVSSSRFLQKVHPGRPVQTTVKHYCQDRCNQIRLTFEQVKVKYTLEQATKDQRGNRRIALLFLQPRRLMGVGGQRHAPAALPPRKDPVPIVQEAGWAPGPVCTGAENLAPPPTGIRSPEGQNRSESLYRLSYPGLTHSNK